jgi:hypothetical protein
MLPRRQGRRWRSRTEAHISQANKCSFLSPNRICSIHEQEQWSIWGAVGETWRRVHGDRISKIACSPCTLNGSWWEMSGILATVRMISRPGRGVSGGGTCCHSAVLPRRSCARWRWRAWASGNWRGSRSDLPCPWPSEPIGRFIWSSSKFATRLRSADPPARCADIWAGGVAREASSAPCPSPPCAIAIQPRGRVVRIWAGPMSDGCSWAMAAKSGHKLARTASTSIPTSD